MIVIFILLLFGSGLYGESSCEKIFSETTFFQDGNELDDTDGYLGYLGDLLDRKIIGEIHLKRVLEGLKNGNLINPITEYDAISSSTKMKHIGIHRDGLQEYLDEDNLDKKRVEDFVIRNLKEEKRVRVKRNETREETKGIFEKMNFIYITPGNVILGEGRNEFEVEITNLFEIMRTPITQHMWAEVMGNNPSEFKEGPDSISININGRFIRMQPDHPIEQVSWDEAQEFIKQINNRSDGYTYRLPSEAEWEYVAKNKGLVKEKFHFGDDETELQNFAWFDKNSNKTTHPVGELKPLVVDGNEIYDLHGNVWEWVEDRWTEKYPDVKQIDYIGPKTGKERVIKGGAFNISTEGCYICFRYHFTPDFNKNPFGFRLVRTK